MGAQAKQTFKLGAAASILLFALVGCASAGAAQILPLNISIGPSTAPPDGWFQFCVDYGSECKVQPSEPKTVALSAHAWKELVRINGWANRHVKPMSDMAHWGFIDRWTYPDDGYGDCKDYVLLKRRTLLQAGWPREALLITVVRDHNGEGHAVLTVKTDKGEFILDNQREGILLWSETGYQFLSRQSQSDPNHWVSLIEPAAESAIAALNLPKDREQDAAQHQIVVSLDPQPLHWVALSVAENTWQQTVVATTSDVAESPSAVGAVDKTAVNNAPENLQPSAAQSSWGVQLIGHASENLALDSYRQLQKRFTGLLGSHQPLLIRTKVGISSYWYRVRVAAEDRGAAEALCHDLRAAGGSCLVQRG